VEHSYHRRCGIVIEALRSHPSIAKEKLIGRKSELTWGSRRQLDSWYPKSICHLFTPWVMRQAAGCSVLYEPNGWLNRCTTAELKTRGLTGFVSLARHIFASDGFARDCSSLTNQVCYDGEQEKIIIIRVQDNSRL
jgi:hypothetical protein